MPWTMKRAALLYDRVYLSTATTGHDADDIPLEMTFGFNKADRSTNMALVEIQETVIKNPAYLDKEFTPEEFIAELEWLGTEIFVRAYQSRGFTIIPVFHTQTEFHQCFHSGQGMVYQAAIEQIPVVLEEKASWTQIAEFRKDPDARAAFASLKNWVRSLSDVQSGSHARDVLAEKITKYTWAIHKHGLLTATGAISGVLGGIAAGEFAKVLGASIPEAISLGSLTIGGITVWLAERLIDRKDIRMGSDGEVAYIFDAKTKLI